MFLLLIERRIGFFFSFLATLAAAAYGSKFMVSRLLNLRALTNSRALSLLWHRACMATMGILYYRIARGLGEESADDEPQ